MSNLIDLICAIRDKNDPDMLNLLREMTPEEVNGMYVSDVPSQRQGNEGNALHMACFVNNTTALVTLLRMETIDTNARFLKRSVNTEGFSWCGFDMPSLEVDYSLPGLAPIMIAAAFKHRECFELLVQDDRVDLKVKGMKGSLLPWVGSKMVTLPDLLKDGTRDNHEMLFHWGTAMGRKTSPQTSKDEIPMTSEVDSLKEFSTDFGNLLQSEEMSDFKIFCENEVFLCHKVILFSRSNMWKTMFNNNMLESLENCTTIRDFKPEIVKLLLHYIYTGRLDIKDVKANAKVLLHVADKYQLKGLTKLCEDQLVTAIDNDTVLDMVMTADLYHADVLKKAAIKWIVENRREISKQEGLRGVMVKFPNLLYDMFDAFSTNM